MSNNILVYTLTVVLSRLDASLDLSSSETLSST